MSNADHESEPAAWIAEHPQTAEKWVFTDKTEAMDTVLDWEIENDCDPVVITPLFPSPEKSFIIDQPE